MDFIGQNRIMMELDILLPQIKNNELDMNFLFRGKSGYGKTLLGLKICSYLANSNYQYLFADNINDINTDAMVIFIDEIHLLQVPEMLYKYLDKKKPTFIFATNEFADLKEPLVNRCTVYTYEDYTEEELLYMTKMYINNDKFSREMLQLICESANKNPRKISNLCFRLNAIGKSIPLNNLEELEFVVEKIIGIIDGLDPMCLKYLEILERLSTSSLENISRVTGISKTTIQHEIEPVLLYKNRISITSRGRSFIK